MRVEEIPEEPPAPVEPPAPATPREKAMALAARLGLAYIDLTEFTVDASVVGMIPDAMARRKRADGSSVISLCFEQ